MEVYHTGDSLWLGTRLPPDHFIAKISDKTAETILSRFKDKKSGKQYVMVVNRSFKKSQPLDIKLDVSVRKVREISKITGKPVKTSYNPKEHTISGTFLPGEGKLYALQ
jgi:23S rRNA-/tRNA-specific pseudouridylate synthase